MATWRQYWSVARWRTFLGAGETESEVAELRECTHTGRPLGTREFIESLEKITRRRLTPGKGGRPAKPTRDTRQEALEFDD
jgi:hypothetical protein